MGPYSTIEEIWLENARSENPVDFADMTVFPEIYAGRYFIAKNDAQREYHIYACTDTGAIEQMPIGKMYYLEETAQERAGYLSKPGPWKSIEEIRLANRKAGRHFFDADTLQFFSSSIYGEIYGGRFFITSEQDSNSHYTYPRKWSIRAASNNGASIDTIGEFQAYDTLEEAQQAVRFLTQEID